MSQRVAPFRGRTFYREKWGVADLRPPKSVSIRGNYFVRFVFFDGNCQRGSNEWCFFGKKRDGFPTSLIYCDFRVVEGRNVLMVPAGITAFFMTRNR
jgi:hypothetical protein